MKYKLKRSPVTLFIFSAIAVFIMLYSIYETSAVNTVSFSSVFALLACIAVVVYEAVRLKGDCFFFDDDTFSIQGESYTYGQIDYLEVYSSHTRYFHTEKLIFTLTENVFSDSIKVMKIQADFLSLRKSTPSE